MADEFSVNVRIVSGSLRVETLLETDTLYYLKSRLRSQSSGWHMLVCWRFFQSHSPQVHGGKVGYADSRTLGSLPLADEDHLIFLPSINRRRASLLRSLVTHAVVHIRPFPELLHHCEPPVEPTVAVAPPNPNPNPSTASTMLARDAIPPHAEMLVPGSPNLNHWEPNVPIDVLFHASRLRRFQEDFPSCLGLRPSQSMNPTLFFFENERSEAEIRVYEMGEGLDDGVPVLYSLADPGDGSYLGFDCVCSVELGVFQKGHRACCVADADTAIRGALQVVREEGFDLFGEEEAEIGAELEDTGEDDEEEEGEGEVGEEGGVKMTTVITQSSRCENDIFRVRLFPGRGFWKPNNLYHCIMRSPAPERLLLGQFHFRTTADLEVHCQTLLEEREPTFVDLTIRHPQGDIQSFRSFFVAFEGEGPVVELLESDGTHNDSLLWSERWSVDLKGEYGMIDSCELLRLLAGSEEVIPNFNSFLSAGNAALTKFMVFYAFFRECRMRSLACVMVHRILTQKMTTGDLIRLLQDCIVRFDEERQSVENPNFSSALTLAVLCRLIELPELRGPHDCLMPDASGYRDYFQDAGLQEFFSDDSPPSLPSPYEHEEIARCALLRDFLDGFDPSRHFLSFGRVYRLLMSQMAGEAGRLCRNIHLQAPGSKARHGAHLELLYIESGFFRNCLHFAGTEWETLVSTGLLKVDNLPEDSLAAILRYYYTHRLPTDLPLKCVSRMLEHSEIFESIDFREKLLHEIRDVPFLTRKSCWNWEMRGCAGELLECKNFHFLIRGWLRRLDEIDCPVPASKLKLHIEELKAGNEGFSDLVMQVLAAIEADLTAACRAEEEQEES